MRHVLKTWPSSYNAVRHEGKRVELRRNDRDYQPGDELELRCWHPALVTPAPEPRGYAPNPPPTQGAYCHPATHRRVERPWRLICDVTHVQRGGSFGLEAGYVAISLGAIVEEEIGGEG